MFHRVEKSKIALFAERVTLDLWGLPRTKKSVRGSPSFTLLELLIVITILAVLSSVVVIVLNPAELLKRARDSTRMNDLGSIERAILYQISFTPDPSILAPTNTCVDESSPTIYVSVPSDNGEASPNNLPSGWNYNRVTQINLKKNNGTGWLPIDFTRGNLLNVLPADTINSFGHNLFYSYVCNRSKMTFEINAWLESRKFDFGGSDDRTSTDGGNNDFAFEVGSQKDLILSSHNLMRDGDMENSTVAAWGGGMGCNSPIVTKSTSVVYSGVRSLSLSYNSGAGFCQGRGQDLATSTNNYLITGRTYRLQARGIDTVGIPNDRAMIFYNDYCWPDCNNNQVVESSNYATGMWTTKYVEAVFTGSNGLKVGWRLDTVGYSDYFDEVILEMKPW